MYSAKISELKKKIETAEEKLVTGVIDRSMFESRAFATTQNEKPVSSFDEPGSFRDLKRGNV